MLSVPALKDTLTKARLGRTDRPGSGMVLGSSASGTTVSRTFVLFHAAGDDPQRAVGKRPRQNLRLVPRDAHPDVHLLGRRQGHRHGLRVDRLDLGVGLSRQEAKDVGRHFASRLFRTDVQFVHRPAKQTSGRLSSRANQMSPPASLLNSMKEDIGTTQRLSTPRHGSQCLL